MRVKILQEGKYADFSRAPKITARVLQAGHIVEYPPAYVRHLLAVELAELVDAKDREEIKAIEEVVEEVNAITAELAAKQGVSLDDPVDVELGIDPAELSARDFRALELSSAQWIRLGQLERERGESARASLVAYAVKKAQE